MDVGGRGEGKGDEVGEFSVHVRSFIFYIPGINCPS